MHTTQAPVPELAPVFATSEEFFAFRDAFRARLKALIQGLHEIKKGPRTDPAAYSLKIQMAPRIQAEDFALYAALRGRDWRKGLAPNTDDNTIKMLVHQLYTCEPRFMSSLRSGNLPTITPDHILRLRAQGIPAHD